MQDPYVYAASGAPSRRWSCQEARLFTIITHGITLGFTLMERKALIRRAAIGMCTDCNRGLESCKSFNVRLSTFDEQVKRAVQL